jgi:hypothetical protein
MTPPQDDTLTIRVSRGFDEVAALRPEWESLPSNAITADFDYYHTAIASEPSMLEPAVFTISRSGRPEAMVIGRLELVPLSLRLGYMAIYEPVVRALTIVYRGFRGGKLDAATSSLLVRELTKVLGEGEIDAIIFRRLDIQHPLYPAATREPALFIRELYTSVGTCWERSLPESLPAFLQSLSKSTRSKIKNYSNRLEREFGHRLEVRRYTDPSDLDTYLEHADVVAAKTYQRGLGVGVRNDAAQRMRTELAMERGWFRAYLLYVDDSPIAFSAGNAYGGRFYYLIPGYDPAYASYRVGTYVFLKMVEDLCGDDSVDILDFGPGEAEHKRHFCDRSWHEAEVYLFAPRARARFINVARATILGANDGLVSTARTVGVVPRVKRWWRDRTRTRRPST